MEHSAKKRLDKLVIIGLLVLVALSVTASCVAGVWRYQRAVDGIVFSGVEIAALPDGHYRGSCDVGMISAVVEVEVSGGAITAIHLLEHKHDRGAAAENLVEQMLEQQQVPVDSVSGATNSSRVIQKAVDNALINGPK